MSRLKESSNVTEPEVSYSAQIQERKHNALFYSQIADKKCAELGIIAIFCAHLFKKICPRKFCPFSECQNVK